MTTRRKVKVDWCLSSICQAVVVVVRKFVMLRSCKEVRIRMLWRYIESLGPVVAHESNHVCCSGEWLGEIDETFGLLC